MGLRRGFCINGHKVREVGSVGGRCWGCSCAEAVGAQRRPGLDVAPLVAFMEGEQLEFDTMLPKNSRDDMAYRRAKKSGRVSVQIADRICIGRGVHPWTVFGDEWLDLTGEAS